MSAAVLVFMTFVTAGALVLVGWSLHGLVLEIRHDCLPHDPQRCKEPRNRRVDTEATS